MKRVLGGVVLVVALVATIGSAEEDGGAPGATASSGGDTGGAPETTAAPDDAGAPDEVDDVTITGCAPGQFGTPTATLQITNDSAEPSTYFIEVAFESPDGSILFDTGFASVSSLRNGQTTTEEAIALDDIDGEFVCRVTSVDRFAS